MTNPRRQHTGFFVLARPKGSRTLCAQRTRIWRSRDPHTRSTRNRIAHSYVLHSPSPMAMSFLTSLLEPLWQEPCSGGIVPMYGVVVPALAAAEGFMRPRVVFAAVTPPPAVRPSFTVGVIVVFIAQWPFFSFVVHEFWMGRGK